MCIIIDTNMAGDYASNKEYLGPIKNYLLKGGRVVISDTLFREYPASFKNVVVELKRMGRISQFVDRPLPASVCERMISNDHHIVGLVRISRVRVVCTKDHELIVDLKNSNVVPKPRCKVYRQPSARRVLVGCCP
jgi:hypothetical protein